MTHNEISNTISSPWNATPQAIWRSPSSLAIQFANPSLNRQITGNLTQGHSTRRRRPASFTTAIKANGKLISTFGGRDGSVETTGASALSIGTNNVY
jgi:hypothetical protein